MGKEKRMENEVVEIERTEDGERLTTNNNKLGRVIATGLVLVTVGVGGLLVGLNIDNNTPHFNVSSKEVLAAKADTTTLDNVIEMKDATAAADLDEVIEIVELSERLHSLDLQTVTEGLEKYEMPTTYVVEDVNALIDQYEQLRENEKVANGVLSQEDRDFTRLALELEAYERCVNGSLSNDAYHELANYGILCVKAKVLDACFFAPEEIDNMKIGSGASAYLITFDDTQTGKCYKVEAYKGSEFSTAGYVYKTIASIYDWQGKAKSEESTGTSYDGERNNDIIEGVNMLKALTVMDCEINNKGQVKVVTPMSDVRDYAKTIGTGK